MNKVNLNRALTSQFVSMILQMSYFAEFHKQTPTNATPTEMVTLLISGLPFTNKVEIIKENNTTKVCETMADYPIVIQRAAGSVWNDGG